MKKVETKYTYFCDCCELKLEPCQQTHYEIRDCKQTSTYRIDLCQACKDYSFRKIYDLAQQLPK
jgi:hypothetical protein